MTKSHDKFGTYIASCDDCTYRSKVGPYYYTCSLGSRHAKKRRAHKVNIIHLESLDTTDVIIWDPPTLGMDPPF